MFGFCSIRRYRVLLIGTFALAVLAVGQTATALSPYDVSYGIQWNRLLEGVGNNGDGGGMVAVAPDGTVWTGCRSSDQTFGPFNGGSSVQGGLGQWSPLGTLITGRMATADAIPPYASQHYGSSIAVNAAGETYQAGLTRYSYPGAPMVGSSEPYVQKRDPAANLLWTTFYGSDTQGWGDSWSPAQNIALDAAGNTWSAGYGNGPLINAGSYTGTGDYDPFIVKINADGSIAGVGVQPHGPRNDRAYQIAVDQNNGNVAICGFNYEYTAGDAALYGTYLGGSRDGFLGIYDSSMNLLSGQQVGGPYRDALYGLTFDSNGDVITGGYVNGQEATLQHEVYVAKYDTAGNLLWSDTFGAPGASTDLVTYTVDVEPDDSIIVTGRTQGDIGGPNAGGYDLFTRKYAKTGPNTYVAQWTQQWGTITDDSETGMDVAMLGKLYVNANTHAAWPGEPYTTTGQAYLMLKIVAGDFTDGTGSGPDGYVDQYDIDYALANLGSGGGLYDFDGDGDEDNDDIVFWKERILDLPPTGPVIIPEPSTLLVWTLLAGLGIVAGWRRRR